MKQRKFWNLILAVLIILTSAFLMPQAQAQESAEAEETAQIEEVVQTGEAGGYEIWIGGTEITDSNLSGTGWSFDPVSYTLTLKDYENRTDGTLYQTWGSLKYYALIYVKSKQSLTIVVDGTCKLGRQFSDTHQYEEINGEKIAFSCIYAIDSDITLTFSYDYWMDIDFLYLNSNAYGIFAKNLTITADSGSLNMTVQSYFNAITTGYDFTVTSPNTAKIELKAYTTHGTWFVYRSAAIEARSSMTVRGNPNLSTPNINIVTKAWGYMSVATQNNAIYVHHTLTAAACRIEGNVEYGEFTTVSGGPMICTLVAQDVEISDNAQLVLKRNTALGIGYRSSLLQERDSSRPHTVHFSGEGSISDDMSVATPPFSDFEFTADEGLTIWRDYYGGRRAAVRVDFAKFSINPDNKSKNIVSYLNDAAFYEDLNSTTVRLDDLHWRENLPLITIDGLEMTLDLTDQQGSEKTFTGIRLEQESGSKMHVNSNCWIKDLSIGGPGPAYLQSGSSTGTLDADANVVITGGSHNLEWAEDKTGTAANADGQAVQKYIYQFDRPVTIQSVTLRTTAAYGADGMYPDEQNRIYLWLTDADELKLVTVTDETGAELQYRVKPGGPENGVYTLIAELNTLVNPIDTAWFVPDSIQDQRLPALTEELSDSQRQDYQFVWLTNELNGVLVPQWNRIDSVNGADYTVPKEKIQDGLKVRCIVYKRVSSNLSESVGTMEVVFRPFTPEIVTHPQNARIQKGCNIDLEVAVGTLPENVQVRYAWQERDYDDIVGFYRDCLAIKVGGGTYVVNTPQYSPYVNLNNNGRQYRCRVTVSFLGTDLITLCSDAATVIVGEAPAIKVPTEEVILEYDPELKETYTLTVELENPSDRFTYQWQYSTDYGKNFQNVEGARSSTYELQAPTLEMDKWQYRCVVSDGYDEAVSVPVPIVAYRAATVAKLKDMTVKAGTCELIVPEFSTGYPCMTIYRFQISTDGGVTFRDVTDEDGVTDVMIFFGNVGGLVFTTREVTMDMDGYQYRLVVGNVYSGKEHIAYSEPGVLHVIYDCEQSGHEWQEDTWASDENNHWRVCKHCDAHGDEAAHTPDREAPGVGMPVLCKICGRTLQEALEYHPCDVNRDGAVNLLDVTRAQRFYGLSALDADWNPIADVNGDGEVNITDLILILNQFFL